uniref:Transmembrane protein 200C n=2 Tax=Oryzias latipes TaxID=8090 RepID=A0A3P9HTX2_ORYLA
MIATGGLLRINARRQDSLRSKPHRTHPHKKKSQKKRCREVVVVKGKVKLCSVSGLVAALGVLVLFVGVCMAALGYWPQGGLLFSSHAQQGSTVASVTSSSPSPAPQEAQGGERRREPKSNDSDNSFNLTEFINGTSQWISQSLLEELLKRYLYSDWLKVFGPLIMGMGIFLFICANAVLHENRDKKTKVINLQDIYSTVIDVHSSTKPPTSGSTQLSSANPLNDLMDCTPSESLNIKSRVCPAAALTQKEGGGGARDSQLTVWQAGRGRKGGETEGGDGGGVIFQKQLDPLPGSSPSFQHRQGFCPSHPLTCWSPPQREICHSFTFPLLRMCPPSPNRRHSVCMGSGATGAEQKVWEDRKGDASLPLPQPHVPATGGVTQCYSSIPPSHMSHPFLSHLLPLYSSTQALPSRRKSFPTESRKPTPRQQKSREKGLGSENGKFWRGVCKDPTSDVM